MLSCLSVCLFLFLLASLSWQEPWGDPVGGAPHLDLVFRRQHRCCKTPVVPLPVPRRLWTAQWYVMTSLSEQYPCVNFWTTLVFLSSVCFGLPLFLVLLSSGVQPAPVSALPSCLDSAGNCSFVFLCLVFYVCSKIKTLLFLPVCFLSDFHQLLGVSLNLNHVRAGELCWVKQHAHTSIC